MKGRIIKLTEEVNNNGNFKKHERKGQKNVYYRCKIGTGRRYALPNHNRQSNTSFSKICAGDKYLDLGGALCIDMRKAILRLLVQKIVPFVRTIA